MDIDPSLTQALKHSDPSIPVLLGLAVILLSAKICEIIAIKFKQPGVLGELLAGIILGNLSLFGLSFFADLSHSPVVSILASIGAIILLFQVGLETKLHEILSVGVKSSLVAIVGVVAPFLVGFYAVGLLMPGLSLLTKLFVGGILTATSVGVTIRVLKDLGLADKEESRIILGAAVIDDILGLVILAVLSGVALTGKLDTMHAFKILFVAALFMLVAGVVGILVSKKKFTYPKIFEVPGTVLILAITICFVCAYIADKGAGLAAIIGAFVAGIILEGMVFKFEGDDQFQNLFEVKHKVREYVGPLALFFVPIFFVSTGMHVDLRVLSDPEVLTWGLLLSFLAIITKIISGFSFQSKNKLNKLLIGMSMVPRGEVGLIFAAFAKDLSILNDKLYVICIIVVIITTIVSPVLIGLASRR